MAKEKTKEEVLPLTEQSFWDENSSFFGIGGTETKKSELEEVLEEVKKPETGITKTESQKEKPAEEQEEVEEEEVTFFEEKKEPTATKAASDSKAGKGEVSSQEDNSTDTGEEDDTEFFKTLTKSLAEKGIFQNIEVKDDDIIDEEKFLELHDTEIEARVEESFEAFAEEMDDDGKAFLKFKRAGGDSRLFFQAYAASLDLPTADITTPEGQEARLRFYYKNVEGIDPEDIDSKIDWAKENKKLEKYAQKYDEILQKADQQRKDRILLEAEQREEQSKKSTELFQKALVETLSKTEEVKGIKFPKGDKELFAYMTKPTVKIAKNKYITGMQAAIGEIFRSDDKTDFILLAKLLQTKFDFSGLKTATKTEKVKEVKESVFKQRDNRAIKSAGNAGKQLADFFA